MKTHLFGLAYSRQSKHFWVCITFCRVRHGDSVTKPDYYYYYYYFRYPIIITQNKYKPGDDLYHLSEHRIQKSEIEKFEAKCDLWKETREMELLVVQYCREDAPEPINILKRFCALYDVKIRYYKKRCLNYTACLTVIRQYSHLGTFDSS